MIRGRTKIGGPPSRFSLGDLQLSRPRPSLSLNFLSGALDPRVTFTRASTATYFNSAGVMQTSAVDTPRFDYDPVTLQPRGLLIEGARTNLFTYSDQLDNAAWTKVRCSASPNVATGPDGALTADKIVEDTSNNSHVVGRSINFTSGVAYTASMVVEAAGRTQLAFIFPGGAFTTSRVLFDLLAVTATVTLGSATATIKNIGGGRYLCTATATATATASAFVELRLSSAGSDTYLGDGVSGVYVWGAQLEAGAYATSYIPTTAAAVTRAADAAVMTGANFSSWYNAAEGALVFESQFFGLTPATNDPIVAMFGTNSATDKIQTFLAGAGPNYRADITSGGVNSFLQNTVNAGDIYALIRSGIAWSAASAYACSNKVTSNPTDTAVVVPTVNRLSINAANSGFHLCRLRYYRTRLPNAKLQELTV